MLKDFRLGGFLDNDWADSINDHRSAIDYIFNLGSDAISWCFKKQPSTTLSPSEAECMAVSSAACQAILL